MIMSTKSTVELIKEYDLMSLENVKQYIGIFTDKTVKPSEGGNINLKSFIRRKSSNIPLRGIR